MRRAVAARRRAAATAQRRAAQPHRRPRPAGRAADAARPRRADRPAATGCSWAPSASATAPITFQQRVAAELDWLRPLLAIFEERPVHRLQAGP